MLVFPYDERFQNALNAISPNLSEDLHRAGNLSDADADGLVALILEHACQCQNIRNIELGREAAAELPRTWLLERIERIAASQLDFDKDDYEYRRLLELSHSLDQQLFRRLVKRGLLSENADVREAAHHFQSVGWN